MDSYFEQFVGEDKNTYAVEISNGGIWSESKEFDTIEDAYGEIERIKEQSNQHPFRYVIIQRADGVMCKRIDG